MVRVDQPFLDFKDVERDIDVQLSNAVVDLMRELKEPKKRDSLRRQAEMLDRIMKFYSIKRCLMVETFN